MSQTSGHIAFQGTAVFALSAGRHGLCFDDSGHCNSFPARTMSLGCDRTPDADDQARAAKDQHCKQVLGLSNASLSNVGDDYKVDNRKQS